MSERAHRELLALLLAPRPPASLRWDEVLSMLRYFGAEVQERSGSRVGVRVNGRMAVFHRPHPQKEASRPLVRALRDFCLDAELDREL